MCSVPGYDASGLVRDLAAEQNKQITSISIGKKEINVTFGLPVMYIKCLMRNFEDIVNNCLLMFSTGSAEGFNKADRDINTAVKSGR